MERDINSIRDNPLAGDQVQAVWGKSFMINDPPIITVQARVGNLVATTYQGVGYSGEVRWQTTQQWVAMLNVELDAFISCYKVIHVVCPESD